MAKTIVSHADGVVKAAAAGSSEAVATLQVPHGAFPTVVFGGVLRAGNIAARVKQNTARGEFHRLVGAPGGRGWLEILAVTASANVVLAVGCAVIDPVDGIATDRHRARPQRVGPARGRAPGRYPFMRQHVLLVEIHGGEFGASTFSIEAFN